MWFEFTLRGATSGMQNTVELRHTHVATHDGNTTFMFDSRSAWSVQYTRRSNLCGMQNKMEIRHSCLIVATHETSCTSRWATYGMQNTMEIRHSCLIVATHETSCTSRWATYGMQNTMKIRHSCFIVATHETSFTSLGATSGMQDTMELRHSCLIVAAHENCAEQPVQNAMEIRLACLIVATHTKVTLWHHQILRLPRKVAFKIWEFFFENGWSVTLFAVRGRSMNPSVRNPPDNWGYFSRSSRAFCSENYNVSRSGSWTAPNIIAPATKNPSATWMQLHQNLAPATKMLNCTKYCTCHEKPMCNLNATSSNFAPATKSDSWTAPNIALPRKLSAQLECTFTKYFACHETNVCYFLPLLHFYPILFFDATILWLCFSFALRTFLWLYCPFILLFFDSIILLLYYSLTLLFFYSAMLLLYYSLILLIILLPYFSLTLVFCLYYYSFIPQFFDSTTRLL